MYVYIYAYVRYVYVICENENPIGHSSLSKCNKLKKSVCVCVLSFHTMYSGLYVPSMEASREFSYVKTKNKSQN